MPPLRPETQGVRAVGVSEWRAKSNVNPRYSQRQLLQLAGERFRRVFPKGRKATVAFANVCEDPVALWLMEPENATEGQQWPEYHEQKLTLGSFVFRARSALPASQRRPRWYSAKPRPRKADGRLFENFGRGAGVLMVRKFNITFV